MRAPYYWRNNSIIILLTKPEHHEINNMTYIHKELAAGRWNELSLVEQMANVGSEVIRAINWKNENEKYSRASFERALELLEFTINDKKNIDRLKEITRAYEVVADYFAGDNAYGSTDKNMENYFLAFNYAARVNSLKQ